MKHPKSSSGESVRLAGLRPVLQLTTRKFSQIQYPIARNANPFVVRMRDMKSLD